MREKRKPEKEEHISANAYIQALEIQVESFALLASRLASLLHSSMEWNQNKVPGMRLHTGPEESKTVGKVEGRSGTSSRSTSTGEGRRGKAAKSKVAPPRRSTERYKAQQKIYQARYEAKKKGLPLPELSKEKIA